MRTDSINGSKAQTPPKHEIQSKAALNGHTEKWASCSCLKKHFSDSSLPSMEQVNVGLALKMMAKIYPSESTTDESLVSSAVILGMMAGQLVFGALGDWLGRQLALCCTLLVCFAGK